MLAQLLCVFYFSFRVVCGGGLLLLYRPRDVSSDCVLSQHLRYDLSFGMGMSDTITLVFRTLNQIDYECVVEIVNESDSINLLIVIRFPNQIRRNCLLNKDAFAVIKKTTCYYLCDYLDNTDLQSPYYVFAVKGRIRFRFASNSSINADMNSHLYQVTATAARTMPIHGCNQKNETICVVNRSNYCFTSGVVCDGIKNCGVSDWFDERKSECGLPVEKLGIAPVVTVTAAILCALLAGSHILLQFLPSLANSFFIFNANEDNRLYVGALLKLPQHERIEMDNIKRSSLIPTFSSSSSETDVNVAETITRELRSLSIVPQPSSASEALIINYDVPVGIPGITSLSPTVSLVLIPQLTRDIQDKKFPVSVRNTSFLPICKRFFCKSVM